MAKTNKLKQIIGLPTMGALREVDAASLKRNSELELIYPTTPPAVARMKNNLSEHGMNNPPIVYQRGQDLFILDGKVRVESLLQLGVKNVIVVVKEIADADIVPAAILTNQRKQKTWLMRAMEVEHLRDYAMRNLSELQRNDESITRANDWVAQMLGFKSQCRVDQLRKIVAFDKDLLAFVDTKEISFQEAYNRATRNPAPPKVKGANKNSFKCNCPLQSTCETLKAFLAGDPSQGLSPVQRGGSDEQAA